MKTALFLTARTRSTRLPRKALLEIQGKPVIQHLIERLKQARKPDIFVLCTSTHPDDEVLAELARANGIYSFQGDETDLLVRWNHAARHYQVDFVAAADGDDLFCDPQALDRTVERFRKTGADYIKWEGLPFGAAPYGMKASAIEKICEIKDDSETEGSGRYFTQTGLFRVETLSVEDPALRRPDVRMTLDYPEDFAFFEEVFRRLYVPGRVFGLKEILALLEEHPEIREINHPLQAMYEREFQRKYGKAKLKPASSAAGTAVG